MLPEPLTDDWLLRLAVLEGFRLHADTAVHANDRQGLARLCRYGSRGPVAEERLSVREDGRYVCRTKRGPVLVLTAAQQAATGGGATSRSPPDELPQGVRSQCCASPVG